MLSDHDIKQSLHVGEIKIEPLNYKDVQPASVDLHLAPIFRRMHYEVRGSRKVFIGEGRHVPVMSLADIPEYSYPIESKSGLFTIHPQEFLLCSTIERVTIGGAHGAKFEGRSSLGRIGLMTHITAGFIDPGFSGNITLELYNVSPYSLELSVGMRIGQLCFFKLDNPAVRLYGKSVGNYHGVMSIGPVPAGGDIT